MRIKKNLISNRKKQIFYIWILHLIYLIILIIIKTQMKFLKHKIMINCLICLWKIPPTKKMKTMNNNKRYYLISRTTNHQNKMIMKIRNKTLCLIFKTKISSNNLISKMINKSMVKINLILKIKVLNWLRLTSLMKLYKMIKL